MSAATWTVAVAFATLAPQQLEPGKRLGLPGAAMPGWHAVDFRRRRPPSQTLDWVERVATPGRRSRLWNSSTRSTPAGSPACALGGDGLGRPCGPREDPIRRRAEGGARAALQPRSHPPRRGDRPIARPLPAPRTITMRGSAGDRPAGRGHRPSRLARCELAVGHARQSESLLMQAHLMAAVARNLDKRCAHRADGAPGLIRSRSADRGAGSGTATTGGS